MRRLAVVLLAGAMAQCTLSSAHVDRTDVTSYGTYEMTEATTRTATETTSGSVHVAKELRLIQTTDTVPRARGTSFGYQFVVQGKPKGAHLAATVVVVHPAF